MSQSTSRPLHVLSVPLPGMHAVEASAGTGKTHNITGLYLRLLLETELTPEHILVVTYTVAATAELRTRIRKGILAAQDAFSREKEGQTPEEELLRGLVERFGGARDRAYRRLGNALRTFDEAAIFTIHGFCQRVLGESAFESGAALESEMLGDQTELLSECVEDFWRVETYEGSALWTRFVLDAKLGPTTLRREIRGLVGKPFEEVLEPEADAEASEPERRYLDLFAEARGQWAAERDTLVELMASPSQKKNIYRDDWVASWAEEMDLELAAATPGLQPFPRFGRFTRPELARGAKKGQEPPSHPFFDTCTAIVEAQAELGALYARRLGILRARLLAFCNAELRRRKEERRVRWFDDLLIDLEEALASPSKGAALAETLRTRFGAALIDEFQDTDALQYSIFRRIYGDGDAPVFLVGDPKQAIYAFRGADVFAYLQARHDARDRYTLDHNYRSDRGVVEGLNAVFGAHENPFVLEDIPFHPAQPARPDRAADFLAATALAPVRAWFLPRDETGVVLNRGDAVDWSAEITAGEIARLLESRAAIPVGDGETEEIHGGHVAVLVRNHVQGQRVRRALSARGIPAVEESQDSVFGSAEAEEVERVLAAIAEPGDERLVRGALCTTLLGVTAERLVELSESEQSWDAETTSFQDHRRTWLGKGFGQMFRRLLAERDVPRRLLAGPDGERRFTNLLQIGELLTHESATGHTGSEKLLQWLAARRSAADNPGAPPAEHLLRLESDARLVQITTLHGSKGLEYPVVFVPFAWSAGPSNADAPAVPFHRPGTDSGRPSIDFGSAQQAEHRALAAREALAEDLRLFYVALTRAKYHCTFTWGAVKGAERAAPAWLFHGDEKAQSYKDVSDRELLADLQRVASSSGGAFAIETVARPAEEAPPRVALPVAGPTGPLRTRVIERKVRNRWRITSFSALRGGRGVDLADRDGRMAPAPPAPEPRRDLFGFPKGARPGVCLHQLFENWDFTDNDEAGLRELVESTLDDFAFPSFWVPTIAKMVRDVTATPLDGAGTLKLDDVTLARRLNEVEFHYPAGRLTLEGLNDLLQTHGYPGVPDRGPDEELPRPLVDGYVKGYIDLVFEAGGRYYLADYKSNWLGSTFEAYRPEALAAVVRHELYTLQYVTYTLALHRLLRLRVPDYDFDRHLGGAYYLFLRGMRPERGATSGVFFDRPPRPLIEELDERIGREPAGATGGAP